MPETRCERQSALPSARLSHRQFWPPRSRIARARDLLLRARAARLTQDSTLTGYDANAYERMSVGMGFKRIGRDRLLMRSERATHVVWQRDKGAIIDVKGQRSAFPMLEGVGHGDADFGSIGDIPYYPGRETLWIGSGLAKADVSENEMIHPLATGAEAYYTYASGDSVGFQLPGGQRIELRELLIRPRQPKWNVAVGSLWFDASTAQLVRAVYRMAQEMDIMAVAKEANEEDHDPDDDIPRWVKPMIMPMKAMVTAITVEYGLHEGRFWLPRSQTVEGDAQVSFMHIPFKLEQRYSYASVNGTEPVPELVIAVEDTARDSVSRAARRERRRSECITGTERIRRENRSDEGLRILIRTPCDTVALARSSELPKSIYDEGETVFGTSERDALVAEALTLGAQPDFAPQRATFSYGLPYTRFNRIEGFSTALAADQVLGRGYSAHAQLPARSRGSLAEWRAIARSHRWSPDSRSRRLSRLVASNDWGDPLGFSSSVSALLFGRDEGFYYRTWGAELKGQKDQGIINSWRLFGEQHFDAAVKTEFSVSHPGGVKGDLTNINAVNGYDRGTRSRSSFVSRARSARLSRVDGPEARRRSRDVRLLTRLAADDAFAQPWQRSSMARSRSARGTSGGPVPIQKQFFLGGVRPCAVRERAPRSEIRSG